MSYAELIEKLENLPAEKKSEVFDFVEFLISRSTQNDFVQENKSKSVLAQMRSQPFTVSDFSPLSREEANVR